MTLSASNADVRASLPHPIVLLGRDDNGKAHASYFSAADGHGARKAAGLMGMVAMRADNDDVRPLINQIPKGKLFNSGKAFVPFVRQDLFKQLAAYLPDNERKVAERLVPASLADNSRDAEGGGAQPQPLPAEPSRFPEDWSKLKVGNTVLATEGPLEGWFEATVIEIKANGALRLKWRDYLDYPPFGRTVEQIALFHPNYVEG